MSFLSKLVEIRPIVHYYRDRLPGFRYLFNRTHGWAILKILALWFVITLPSRLYRLGLYFVNLYETTRLQIFEYSVEHSTPTHYMIIVLLIIGFALYANRGIPRPVLSQSALYGISTIMTITAILSNDYLLVLFLSGFTIAVGTLYTTVDPQLYKNERAVSAALALYLIVGLLTWEATNLFELYFGLEVLGLILFTLLVAEGSHSISTEAAVKYLVQSTITGFISLYAILNLQTQYGTLDLDDLAGLLLRDQQIPSFFLFAVFMFKLSAAPFHAWTPEVYGGANKRNIILFGIVNKILAFQAFLKLSALFDTIPLSVAFLSILIGAIGCFKETSIKRFFAYSTISNVGFCLIPFAFGQGIEYAMVYALIYFSLNLLWFYGWSHVAIVDRGHIVPAEFFHQLGSSNKRTIAILAFILFEFSGLPPSIMFGPKFFIGAHLMASTTSFVWVAVFAFLVALLAIGYIRVLTLAVFSKRCSFLHVDQPVRAPLYIYTLLVLTEATNLCHPNFL